MANPEHIRELESHLPWWQQGGLEDWNQWMADNRDAPPDLSSADLRGASLSGADLVRANLSGANLEGSYLEDANLSFGNLTVANLTAAKAMNIGLFGARLQGAVLQEAEMWGAKATGSNFQESDLEAAILADGCFYQADFREAVLRNGDLRSADLRQADLRGANLEGADLTGASLVETNLRESANIAGCRVYGISAWRLEVDDSTIQSNLVMTRENEATVTVDNIEIAQFLYLLLHNEKIGDAIDTIGRKGVLIIGRFTEERKAVLHAIRDQLRDHYQLLPLMFEFDPLSTEPTIKTLSTLAHLSRFVIADLTDAKSILQELTMIVHDMPTLPVQPLLHESAEMPPMADSFLIMQSVMKPYVYTTRKKLIADLDAEVVGPPQGRALEVEEKLKEIREKWLPWQNK